MSGDTNPPCPACGYVDPDLWEYPEGTQSIECGSCGANLVLTVTTYVDYTLDLAEEE